MAAKINDGANVRLMQRQWGGGRYTASVLLHDYPFFRPTKQLTNYKELFGVIVWIGNVKQAGS